MGEFGGESPEMVLFVHYFYLLWIVEARGTPHLEGLETPWDHRESGHRSLYSRLDPLCSLDAVRKWERQLILARNGKIARTEWHESRAQSDWSPWIHLYLHFVPIYNPFHLQSSLHELYPIRQSQPAGALSCVWFEEGLGRLHRPPHQLPRDVLQRLQKPAGSV